MQGESSRSPRQPQGGCAPVEINSNEINDDGVGSRDHEYVFRRRVVEEKIAPAEECVPVPVSS